MFHGWVSLLFLYLFSFSVVVTADTTVTESGDDKRALTCEENYKQNRCEKFKAELPKKEQSKVINCSVPNGDPGRMAISCGQGMVNFVVDFAMGIITAPETVGKVFAEGGDCIKSPEKRAAILAPVKTLLTQEIYTNLVTSNAVGCGYLAMFTQSTIRQEHQRIAQVKLNQKKFSEALANSADGHLSESLAKRHPEKDRSLSPSQLKWLAQQSDIQSVNWNEIWREIQKRFQCFTPEVQAQLTCELVANLFGGGATGALLKSKAVVSRLQEVARLAKKAGSASKAAISKMLAVYRLQPDFPRVMAKAETALGRKLTKIEEETLYRAHLVGQGEVGANGKRAGIGNYTKTQKKEKIRILKSAFSNKEEWKKLMKAGAAGRYNAPLAQIAPRLPPRLPDHYLKKWKKSPDAQRTFQNLYEEARNANNFDDIEERKFAKFMGHCFSLGIRNGQRKLKGQRLILHRDTGELLYAGDHDGYDRYRLKNCK